MAKNSCNWRYRRAKGVLPLLLICAPLALSGCGNSPFATVRQIAEVGQEIKKAQGQRPVRDVTAGDTAPLPPNEAVLQAALSQSYSLAENLKPSKSGPGLVICEPEISANDGEGSTPFSAGSGRWLHLAASGLPQFGKTPSWYAFNYALREMGKNAGRVSRQEAVALAKILSVTHVATGVLSGDKNQSTLTYNLWKMPEQKAVGAPIVVSGTRAQIAARLPLVAKTLATRLNGNPAFIPAKIEVSAPELELIGKAPRHPALPADVATAQTLKNLAARSPLAGMQYIAHLSSLKDEDDDADAVKAVKDAAQKLLQQAPKNPLVLAQVGLVSASVLDNSKDLKNLAARFPNSYLVAYAELKWQGENEQRDAERGAAERAVAASPGSAWAWLQLENAFHNSVDDVRDGRFFNRMTAAEQRFVAGMYPQMVQTCLQAVRCDKLNAEVWQRLSYAAAADGDDELADAAFWKAMSLASSGDTTLKWGLQLYQPKWGGDASKLRHVARMIMADKARFTRMYWDVVDAFQDSKRDAEAKQYENLAVKALEEWLQAHPEDAERRADFGNLLKVRGDYAGAREQFETLIEEHPDEDDGYHGLALVNELEKNWDGALQNFLKAIERDPENREAMFRGGQVYHQKGQYAEAEALYKRVIAMYPEYADPHNRLADLHRFVKRDRIGAEQLYRKAIELDPEDQLFRENLQRCLAQ